jgi:hypothetical protein
MYFIYRAFSSEQSCPPISDCLVTGVNAALVQLILSACNAPSSLVAETLA